LIYIIDYYDWLATFHSFILLVFFFCSRPKSKEMNLNHPLWPVLIRDPRDPKQHLVVILYLSPEGYMIWTFNIPTVKMVVEICNKDSTRSPNSFIIFRTFFSRSVDHVPRHYVGVISNIARLIWIAATENLRNAFKSLEMDAARYLSSIRELSIVMHNEYNKSQKATSYSYSSNFEINNGQNYPPLIIDITNYINKASSGESLEDPIANEFLVDNENLYFWMSPQVCDYLNYYDYGDRYYGDAFDILNSPSFSHTSQTSTPQVSTPLLYEGIPIQYVQQPLIVPDNTGEFVEFYAQPIVHDDTEDFKEFWEFSGIVL
jgi:hypothetical protein